MVKLKGPGLATGAAGQLAGQLIFSNWKHTAYLKQHRKPKQPRTAAQRATRAVMAFLSEQWAGISKPDQDTWIEPAARTNISPINAYQAQNLTDWSTQLYPSKTFPAARNLFWGTQIYMTVQQDGERALWAIMIDPLSFTWGAAIHEVPVSAGQPTPLNLIKLLHIPDTGEHTWHTRRLAPGEYYFRVALFSVNGKAALPGGPRSVIIT